MKNYYFNKQIGLGTFEEDKQEIKKILDKKVGNYSQYIIYLTNLQIKRFESACKNWLDRKEYIIPIDYKNLENKKRFIVFLTKSQIKKLLKAQKNNKKVDLKISKAQFKKTCHLIIELNKDLKSFLKGRKKQNSKKPNLLDLINFCSEPEPDSENLTKNIDETEDLIKFNCKSKKQKVKKYNLLKDEDLIPNYTSTPNGFNVLVNILKSPKTKEVLGLTLTRDLTRLFKRLDTESSLSISSIISSLLTNISGKALIFTLTQDELKKIIECIITILAILLSPERVI